MPGKPAHEPFVCYFTRTRVFPLLKNTFSG